MRVKPDYANWIGGAWVPAASAHVYELELDAADERGACVRERWPRSGEADLRAAFAHASRAARGWHAIGSAARTYIVESAARLLAEDPDPGDVTARRLGLSRDELAFHHAGLAELSAELRGASAPPGVRVLARGAGQAPGTLLFLPHWSELTCEPARLVLSALALGHTAIWIADPEVPSIADAIVRALADAGLPAGVLALLHDDGETVLRAAIASPETTTIEASGPAARMRRLERLVARLRPDEARVPAGSGAAGRATLACTLRRLRNRSHVVGLGADVAAEARFVVEQAFGRVTALTGEKSGRIGRVLCDARLFSRFTAALLAELDQDPDLALPPAFVEGATAVHLRRAGELGLDEGATPVYGPGRPRADEERAEARGFRALRADATLSPLVFTNVEEHMRLAWLGRPAPILCLLRVESEAAGRALAEELDGDPLAEDLSAEPDATT